jgi:antitoxin component of RelBE/YafQ-DinJ toxin-antitoxin module
MAEMREAIANGLKEAMDIMKNSGLTVEQAIAMLNETNRLDTITTAAAHGNLVIIDTKPEDSNDLAKTIAAMKAAAAKKKVATKPATA